VKHAQRVRRGRQEGARGATHVTTARRRRVSILAAAARRGGRAAGRGRGAWGPVEATRDGASAARRCRPRSAQRARLSRAARRAPRASRNQLDSLAAARARAFTLFHPRGAAARAPSSRAHAAFVRGARRAPAAGPRSPPPCPRPWRTCRPRPSTRRWWR
jgi:hypothetical protein